MTVRAARVRLMSHRTRTRDTHRDKRCDIGRSHETNRPAVLPAVPTTTNSPTRPTLRNVPRLFVTLAGWTTTILDPHRDCRRDLTELAGLVAVLRDQARDHLSCGRPPADLSELSGEGTR